MSGLYCGNYKIINIVTVNYVSDKEFAIGYRERDQSYCVTHCGKGEYYWSQYDFKSYKECLEWLATKGDIVYININKYSN